MLAGRLAEVLQNNVLAMEAYQRALVFNAWSVDALHAIASILRAEDKYGEAVDYINRILKIQPLNGESWSSLGINCPSLLVFFHSLMHVRQAIAIL